ncbi:37S ribosomal protein subunit S8, mitochondrial [Schizosaccharomyces pombe]|uniref:Small ribosomal subunit protein uS8m n=1 Tax=Schizosaccharomyces pombe (strain 972 / ATCC 24843) TaxID=284812 RepID=RT08_SCHPO|nr:putative mitochondrial ribosomal protein subunit S8 [Schizosaccharomyces pombe]O74956.1 RecName: Full=Small ribosomal subunit protein uS8m; AltName: Full=37S ribosomal protein subunit S8, mitochondrial [Schizosaccharomyces pombe 972h-]CAA19274.1 mitochondrial ribosomal protein subunit S8 (predicted) [Schizosaccharomyces pombe]|eukprot:NP_587781.1 putative mitochondrial ribosomal protein subunit S8 [Schizosaccharomyces pombe]
MQLHYVFSHLQNSFRARKSLASVPNCNSVLELCAVLYHQGFLSSIQRGDIHGPDALPTITTRQNVATRRLWLGLKYFEGKPVLHYIRAVSKPSRKVNLTPSELLQFAKGRKVSFVNGLEPAEVGIVETKHGIMSIDDAIKNNLGGNVICRVK